LDLAIFSREGMKCRKPLPGLRQPAATTQSLFQLIVVFSIFRFFLGSQPLKEGKIDASEGHPEYGDIADQGRIEEPMHHPADLPSFNYFSTIL
jgi:hypothetical protein